MHSPRTEIPILLGEPAMKEQRNSFERNAMLDQTKRWLRTVFLRDFSASQNFASENNHEGTKSTETEKDQPGHSAVEIVPYDANDVNKLTNIKKPDKKHKISLHDALILDKKDWSNLYLGPIEEKEDLGSHETREPDDIKWSSKKMIIIWIMTAISVIVLIITISMCGLDFCD
ncbi:Hypothetical predicted protein [Octopus vulgaris]|uniref:Uncharacterized protein n=1 Tax=Octopus vulgaris TaxID=6645 RepID=A0AA36FH35_OCTVU|nr:Hypothetical predicted protein [Octopus vulgaris]